jgi:hypothetical protein
MLRIIDDRDGTLILTIILLDAAKVATRISAVAPAHLRISQAICLDNPAGEG